MNTFVFATVCLALIFSGFAVGILFSMTAFQPSVSSGLPEYLLLSEPEYHVGTDGWFAMAINNTGIGSVTIVKVSVNNIKQSSTNPFLAFTVAPDRGFVLNVTMAISLGVPYQIDLYTSQGNKFSKTLEVFYSGQQTGVMLYKANVNFYNVNGVKKIDIDVGNSGTENTRIVGLYIGTSKTTEQNQTIGPVTLLAGSVQRLTINYDWTAGSTYWIKMLGESGQSLEWPEQSPVPTEQVIITNMQFGTGSGTGWIYVVANNTGTTTVTINEAWINNVKTTSSSPALPYTIQANSGLALNITRINVSQGFTYQVKLISSNGNQFLYTGTAPS